jgi:MFS family permease
MLTLTVRRRLAGVAETLRYYTAPTVDSANARQLIFSGSWVGLIEGGVITYLPVFLARLGASPFMMGLYTSGQFLLGSVAYIPGGAYAERHADQVRLTNISSVATRSVYLIIALLPFFLAPPHIVPAIIVAWTLMAVPLAVFVPSFFTVLQQAVPLSRRSQFLGIRWSMMTVVSAVSIPMFGLLLDRTSLPTGYQSVFAISFLAGLIHVVNFSRIKVPPFVQAADVGSAAGGIPARLRGFLRPFVESRLFVRYSLATVGFRTALYIPYSLFSIYWVNYLHASDTVIGLRGGVGYTALALGYILWGQWSQRWGDRIVLLISGLAFGCYPLITALLPAMEWLPLAAVVWGLAGSGIDIGLFTMMMAVSPEDKRPRFVAATYVLSSITSFIGPMLGAGLAEAVDVRSALFIGGGLQVVTALLFLWLPRREEISGPAANTGHVE